MPWWLIAIAVTVLVLGAGAIGILIWLRQTLLSNVACVEVDAVDPTLRQEIERLELDYAVAEELGYPGEVLVHLEAKLNAAKLAASGDPNATMVVIVQPPPVVTSGEASVVGVFTSAFGNPLPAATHMATAQSFAWVPPPVPVATINVVAGQ